MDVIFVLIIAVLVATTLWLARAISHLEGGK